MLRAYLFGGLELIWDEHPLPSPPGAMVRSLLAYLLTYRDRPHTRDLLAGTFWPDLPDATAHRRLSQALWQIRRPWRQAAARRGLPAPAPLLQVQGAALQLNPDLPLWLDTEEFSRQHARCSAGATADLQAGLLAVELYRGEFLAGHYQDWAIPERERLRGMLLEVLGRLLEGHKGAGDYERALACARRLAAEDPWHEGAHREVMRLCHLAGRDGEALAQYETCRRVLAEELDSAPAPETAALAAEIAAQAGLPAPPLLPTSARAVQSPLLERPDQLPLVGRRAEMAELVHQIESAAAGNGGLTILYGEAGVGKSRLLREVAGNAGWRGLQVAWGRCYELAAPPAYQPLVEVLRAQRPALRQAALPPLWQAELSRLLPELGAAARAGLAPAPGDQQRLLEAIASALLALAAATPLLMLLEDAQWMDPASLEALHYLLPRLGEAPLRILVSVRSEELAGRPAAALAAMEGTRRVHRLELGGLDQAETAELVQRALAMERAVPRFSARLYAETEGNPFFLVETLWTLVQEGLLYRDNAGLWGTPWDESTADYGELPLPAGVAQSIARRLERLSAPQRELLQLAAVIGRQVDFSLWLAASGQDEGPLLAGADALCASGLLLAAGPQSSGGADYAFGHDLIRRVCYERLAGPRRRAYHRRVAQALERLAPEEPAALAYHWTQAEVWDRAVEYQLQAGHRARMVYAHTDAAAHYTRALEALGRLPGPVDLRLKYNLHLARESVYGLSGERKAQAEDLQVLEALADALDDDGRRAEAALRRAGYASATGDFPAAIAAVRQAVSCAVARGELHLEAEGRRLWGLILLRQGDYGAARPQLEQALALGRSADLRQVEADSLRDLGVICWYLGDSRQAQSYFEQAFRIYGEIGDRLGEGRALNNLGLVAVNQGDYLRARACFERCLHLDRQMGSRFGESLTLGNLGSIAGDSGDYDAARVYYEQALRLCREIGNRQTEAVQLGCLSLLCHHLGDQESAREYGQQVLRIGNELGDRVAQAYGWTYLGHALMGLGLLTEAAEAYRQALGIRRELGQSAMAIEVVAGLARVALAGGELSQAQAHGEEILRHLETASLEGADEPLRVSLTCYRVLQARQDPRAEGVLNAAQHLLQERAGRIGDAQTRRSFLENVVVHRQIVAAYREQQAGQRGGPVAVGGQLPEIAVSLPRADAPRGRPLRPDEFVTVTWTVQSPEDKEQPGKVAQRRRRIVRLLAEAQAQGAAPRDEDLAAALGVSLPTLRRDMAALRAQGHRLPTRGREK